MADINKFMEQVKEFDVNEIDWERVGVWPLFVRCILFAAAIVVVLVATYFFLIKDKKKEFAVKKNEEVQLRTSFENKAYEAQNINAYRKQMRDMQESFDAVIAQLPEDIEVPDLLEDIDEKIVSSRLAINRINPLEVVSKEFYVELPIEIEVVGGYHQFGSFISGIAGMSRIVTLHDFSIKADPQRQNSNKLTMSITARTYKYKVKE